MDLSFAAFLLLCLAAARAAPVGSGPQRACADVRDSSVVLNKLAKSAVEKQRLSKDFGEFNTSLAWMEAKDMCDPSSLKHKSLPCLEKMLSVLLSYMSEVERVSSFQSCSAFASDVKPALQNLHKDMSVCVNSIGERRQQEDENHISEEESQSIANWKKEPLCHYIMDRLFSFSILTARVFAVGDPTLHSSSAAKC